jgi:hypothetical protein
MYLGLQAISFSKICGGSPIGGNAEELAPELREISQWLAVARFPFLLAARPSATSWRQHRKMPPVSPTVASRN